MANPEFSSSDALEKALPAAEMKAYKDALSALDVEARKVTANFNKADVLYPSTYRRLNTEVSAVEAAAIKIIESASASGVGMGEGELHPFIEYLRRKVDQILSDVNEYTITVDPARPPIKLEDAGLSRYLEQTLKLRVQMAKGTSPDTQSQVYRDLKTSPAARLIPSVMTKVQALNAEFSGIADTEPAFAVEALLKDVQVGGKQSTEAEQLKRLLEAKKKQLPNLQVVDPTAVVVEGKTPQKKKLFQGDLKTIFIFNNGKPVNDFLVTRLQKTQLYENSAANNAPNEKLHPDILFFLLQLKYSLEDVRSKADDLKKLNDELGGGNSAGNPDELFSEYGLTRDRVEELLKVIDMITDVKKTPPVTEWNKVVLEGIQLYETKKEGEKGADFLARIKAKVEAGQQLDPTEQNDLRRLLTYLKSQLSVVDLAVYEDIPNQDYTPKLRAAQKERLTSLTNEVEAYAQLVGAVAGPETTVNNEREAPKAVWLIYNILRGEGNNPNLPEKEQIAEMGFGNFMENVQIAIFNYLYSTALKGSVDSGNLPLRLPGTSHVDLWTGVQFEIGTTTTDRTLKFFFNNFPWKATFGEAIESPFNFVDRWENRMYALSSLHNLTSDLQKIISTVGQTPEVISQVVNRIAGAGSDTGRRGGPMMAWSLDAVFGTPKEQNAGMDERWNVGQLIQHYRSVFEREIKTLSDQDSATRDVLVLATKAKAIESIPEKFRVKDETGKYIDGPILEFAWDIQYWYSYSMLTIQKLDQGALDTKLPHATGTGDYLGKVISPEQSNTGSLWRQTTEQLVRILPTRDEILKFYVTLEPGTYTQYTIQEIIDERIEHKFLAMTTEEHREKAADASLSAAERQRHQQLVTTPLSNDERAKHAKSQADLEEFILSVRKRSVGSLEDLNQLGRFSDLHDHLHKIESYIHTLEQAIHEGERKVPPSKRLLIYRHKHKHSSDLLNVLHHAEHDAKAKFRNDDDRLDYVIRVARDFSVNSRYRIIRFKDNARILDGQGVAKEDVAPIAISEGKFRVAENRAPGNTPLEKRLHKRSRTIPMSMKEITTSRLDLSRVDWESVTPRNSEVYLAIWKNFEFIFKGLNVQDQNGFFPPLESVINNEVVARYSETDWEEFKHDLSVVKQNVNLSIEAVRRMLQREPKTPEEKLKQTRENRKRLTAIAMEIDHLLGHHVWVNEITQLELFKGLKEKMEGVARMSLSKVTQDGRYSLGPAIGAVGPKGLPGETQPTDGEVIVQMLTEPYQDPEGNLSDFMESHPDPADWKKVIGSGAVQRKWRDAADLAELEDGKITAHQAATNQMIVELMRLALGMYLDQYRYDKTNEPEPTPFNLAFEKRNNYTISGAKPLSFVERAFFVQLCKSIFATFARPEFGGNVDGVDEKSPVGIIHAYDGEEVAYELMLERGLIGPHSIAVDLLRIEEFHHMPTPSQKIKKDAKGH